MLEATWLVHGRTHTCNVKSPLATSFGGVADRENKHLSRDGKLTGKFGYQPRPVPFGTGMKILYSGMGRVWVPSQKPDSGLGRVWDFSYPPRPAPNMKLLIV